MDTSADEYYDLIDLMGEWEQQLEDHEPAKMKSRIERILLGMGFSEGDFERDTGECYVRHFSDDSLKRHEDSKLYGFSPMPTSLDGVRRDLKHGGPHSFTKEGYYALDPVTGRCECMASTYHGVRSALGMCKHERVRQLVHRMRNTQNYQNSM